MKTIILLLAMATGAGFFFRDELQSWSLKASGSARQHQAPTGVYYLRTALTFQTTGGAIRWSPGQELRTAMDTVAAHGFVTLTDGVNTTEVPQTAVTTDMDDAVALRQLHASNQDTVRQSAERETRARTDALRQNEAAQRAEIARQVEAARQANSNRIVSGQFHPTVLDAPAVRTALPENIVSTAGAPVIYYPYVVNGSGNATQVNQAQGSSGRVSGYTTQGVSRAFSTPAPSPRN